MLKYVKVIVVMSVFLRRNNLKYKINYFRASCVLKSEQFNYIIELATRGQYDFPQIIKRGLMHAVVQAGTVVQNTSTEQYYWSQTIESLQNRCTQLISSDNFMSSYHQEEIKIQIIDILESFIGNLLY